MKKNMKSGKMLKKADALKGFLGSMSKKKGEMGMGMTPPSNKITSAQSKNLGVAKGTPYKTSATPSDKINTVRSNYPTPPRSSAEVNAYMLNKNKPAMKPGMKKGGLKTVDAEKNPGLAKLPTAVRNKMGYMKKGGMSRMANEGFKNAKRTITDGYKGTGAPNPLAAIVKNTAKKSKMSKMGMKPKMQMGGPFFSMNPSTPMIATEGKDFINKESFKKGGMYKKKKK